ncbi:hypothetical protein BT63DRAFT_107802 [Microthyrium microscopicum]|uniref:Uncharacterized protein n=1 Tax=Microthyrium microscopicum TaxID=703497 RepID=A0A6A6TYK6_9PEZI|nr:hypothetical protein BT63DRAFT_107802 [Microthyrium microscopicum]
MSGVAALFTKNRFLLYDKFDSPEQVKFDADDTLYYFHRKVLGPPPCPKLINVYRHICYYALSYVPERVSEGNIVNTTLSVRVVHGAELLALSFICWEKRSPIEKFPGLGNMLTRATFDLFQ